MEPRKILKPRHLFQHILFTDEVSFSTTGAVSSQNCRYWTTENPQAVINCKSQYLQKTNVNYWSFLRKTEL